MVGTVASITAGASGAWATMEDETNLDSLLLPADSAPVATPTQSPAVVVSPPAVDDEDDVEDDDDDVAQSSTTTTSKPKTKPKTKPQPSASTPAQPTATPSTPVSSDGTFSGGAARAGAFGKVQVQITVASGKVTAINILQVPTADSKSVDINNRAIPRLIDDAIASQSASVSNVSGASYTSRAFKASLQSALTAAGL